MVPALFVTLAALTLSSPRPVARSPHPEATRAAAPAPVPGADLYSLRAKRRFAAYLRLRLLELRAAGLSHAADVIERRLGPDALLPRPPS
jgi:hypothetical protein